MAEPQDENPELAALAEELISRLRRGESLELEEYVAAHPEHAEALRELVPTLQMVEELLPGGAPRPEAGDEAEGDAPDRIGDFEILGTLGRGGMGIVYEARPVRRPELPELVALKLVHPHLVDQPTFQDRFMREAEMGRRVKSPAVVRTLDAGIHDRGGGDSLPYLVMERVSGVTLRELAAGLGGALPEPLLRKLGQQIAEGLAAIHDEGIVHRDLKPTNVMVTPDHRVCITDLGVARMVEGSVISATNQFLGSVRYAAPEQFDRKLGEVGPAADLYALGVTLYELATGEHPYAYSDFHSLFLSHLTAAARPARQLAPELSELFEVLVGDLLVKDPGERLADAALLRRILAEGEQSEWWAERRARMDSSAALVTRPPVARDLPLVGRDREMESLRAALASARAGEGRAMFLRGEAGVGKTRVVSELVAEIPAGEVRVLYGAFRHGGEWDAMREAIQAANLQQATPAQTADLPDAGRIAGLTIEMLKGLAAAAPLVWIVDALHLASPAGLELYRRMVRATAGRPVLLIGASQDPLPLDCAEEMHGLAHVEELLLERLRTEETRELVRRALGTEDWSEPLLERLVVESAGNPLLVVELAREIRERRREGELPGFSEVDSALLQRLPVPEALMKLLRLRLAAISQDDRALLECAAVLGYRFDAELVADVLKRDPLEVLQRFAALGGKAGLVRSAGEHISFEHPPLRDVVLDGLHPRLRRAYHRRIAQAAADRAGLLPGGDAAELDPDEALLIATHSFEAGEVELGLSVAVPAVARLNRLYREDATLALVAQALDACRDDPALRASLLCHKVRALAMQPEYASAREQIDATLEEMCACAEEAGSEALIAEAALERGRVHLVRCDYETSAEWLERSLAASRQGDDWRAVHHVLLHLAGARSGAGRIDEAHALATEARDLAARHGNRAGEAKACMVFATSYQRTGDHVSAQRAASEAIGLLDADDPTAQHLLGRAWWAVGFMAYSRSRLQEAQEALQRSLEIVRGRGEAPMALSVLEILAGVLLGLGRLEDGLEVLERVERERQELGSRHGMANARANMGSVLIDLGRLAEAEAQLRSAQELDVGDALPQLPTYIEFDLARLRHLQGDLPAAMATANRALEMRRQAPGGASVANSLMFLGSLELENGDRDSAGRRFREAEQEATGAGDAASAALAAAWLALLGERPIDGVEVPEECFAMQEVQLCLLLAACGAPAHHAGRAEAILEEVESRLADEAARSVFRTSGAIHRLRRFLLLHADDE